ncbi:hypothetical protein QSJ19_01515 [Gordonia sp. ABSL11-1]|uniref:hypothetical protein n=1 Tax=Gordonia sp. ABSL11-1 TaxID=3053924 RepID=UPI00257289AB|nr:hypothetical protein [Gordonia sp. ABSL11-1]MDL9944281.1 hypothetical protein [Gordonia sp. ABSL11-1]
MTARALGSAVLIEGAEALRYLNHAQVELVRKLQRAGMQPHPELVAIAHAAHAAMLSLSKVGHVDGPEAGAEPEWSPTELISAADAAEILGVSRRHVVRIGTSLDGEQLANGHWVFRRGSVEDYAEGRRDEQRRRRTAA